MYQVVEPAPINRVDLALEYSRRGWPVIPLHYPTPSGHCSCKNQGCRSIGKHPCVANGLKDASLSERQILRWWQTFPDANVGILTGTKSKLFVLDIDPRHGGLEGLDFIRETIDPLVTLIAKTGGGGFHFYFQRRAIPAMIPSRTNVLPGVDIKSDGGYVVAPGSLHASGRIYAWEEEQRQLSPLPSKLIEFSQQRSAKTQPSERPLYTSQILEGARNSTLTRIAGFLRHIGIGDGALETSLLTLNSVICNPSLPDSEVRTICRSIVRYESKTWQEPLPLDTKNLSGPPLSADLIPEKLRDWILDIAERMNCPLAFVAAPALVALSGVIGRSYQVHPKVHDDWGVIPNLWGAIVAPPGSMKSPAMAAGLKPLRDAAKSLTAIDSEIRLVTSDATIEKLLVLMQKNPLGITLIRDELTGWLQMMHRSGREGEREFYLEAWNGNSPYTMDRIGRGSVAVDAMCLSVIGGIQPENLDGLVLSNHDGLVQRFQMLVVGSGHDDHKTIDRKPNEEAFQRVEALFQRFMDPRVAKSQDPLAIRFSPAAAESFNHWGSTLTQEIVCLREKHPLLASHLAKYSSLASSLALIFELLGEDTPQDISLRSMELAAKWCAFLRSHAEVFYRMVTNKEEASSAKMMAEKILEGRIKDGDRPRDIYRRGWKGLETAARFTEAQEFLERCHWVRLDVTRGDGDKSREVLRINPNLRGKA